MNKNQRTEETLEYLITGPGVSIDATIRIKNSGQNRYTTDLITNGRLLGFRNEKLSINMTAEHSLCELPDGRKILKLVRAQEQIPATKKKAEIARDPEGRLWARQAKDSEQAQENDMSLIEREWLTSDPATTVLMDIWGVFAFFRIGEAHQIAAGKKLGVLTKSRVMLLEVSSREPLKQAGQSQAGLGGGFIFQLAEHGLKIWTSDDTKAISRIEAAALGKFGKIVLQKKSK